MNHHNGAARSQQGGSELGVENDVHLLPPTMVGDGNLVPDHSIPACHHTLGDIRMAVQMVQLMRTASKQDVVILAIDTQKLCYQIAGVDADTPFLVICSEHHADPHS